ncbi:MAG: IS3 family transposase [Burkholderiaceae bacterium]
MSELIRNRPSRVPLSIACDALGLNRSTVYRRQRQVRPDCAQARSRREAHQPRALSQTERDRVVQTLNDPAYQDQPAMQVYHALLSQGRYLCSISTMHRILRSKRQHGERRAQRPAQHNAIPRLLASQPNQVWCWDISKLPTVSRGQYLSLYVVLDLYSRFVLGWMVSLKENSALSRQLMDQSIARYGIAAGQLTIHQDRGSPMIAHGYLEMLSELDVTASHSRPRVSNDNAFSESQFRTMKYQPDYPGRFQSYEHAEQWCAHYFDWYNFAHQHSSLAGFTPEQVFTGRYVQIATTRQATLDAQYGAHPERFVKGRPTVAMPPTKVAINPLLTDAGQFDTSAPVNFPTLSAAKTKRSSSLIPK